MANINRVMVSGRLTRDPELRSTAGGTSVLGISLAVNDRRKNQQTGQWEDYPNFVDCTVFGNRADGLARVLSKGALVCAEGKLHWSSWEKDGQRHSKLVVYVDELEFASPAPGGRQGQAQPQAQPPAAQAYAAPDAPADDGYGEEIPF